MFGPGTAAALILMCEGTRKRQQELLLVVTEQHAGRFPKRQLHNEWRQLAALLLGVSELTMCEDIKHPKFFEVCEHQGGTVCGAVVSAIIVTCNGHFHASVTDNRITCKFLTSCFAVSLYCQAHATFHLWAGHGPGCKSVAHIDDVFVSSLIVCLRGPCCLKSSLDCAVFSVLGLPEHTRLDTR